LYHEVLLDEVVAQAVVEVVAVVVEVDQVVARWKLLEEVPEAKAMQEV